MWDRFGGIKKEAQGSGRVSTGCSLRLPFANGVRAPRRLAYLLRAAQNFSAEGA